MGRRINQKEIVPDQDGDVICALVDRDFCLVARVGLDDPLFLASPERSEDRPGDDIIRHIFCDFTIHHPTSPALSAALIKSATSCRVLKPIIFQRGDGLAISLVMYSP